MRVPNARERDAYDVRWKPFQSLNGLAIRQIPRCGAGLGEVAGRCRDLRGGARNVRQFNLTTRADRDARAASHLLAKPVVYRTRIAGCTGLAASGAVRGALSG